MPCDPPCPEGCEPICDLTVTWTPDPERRYRWPSGLYSGPGLKLISDGQGGGTILGRSKTTMRWVVLCQKQPHSAEGTP